MILDTSFVIDLMKADDRATGKLDDLEDRGAPVEITPITAYELHYGAHRYHDTDGEEEKISATLAALGGLETVPLEWGDGVTAAEVMHRLETRGDRIDFHDAAIAAAALNRNLPVLTRNESHFERVEGLRIETY